MGQDDTSNLVQKRYTVIADLRRGDSIEQVTGYLAAEGWNHEEAVIFVTAIRDEQSAGGRELIDRTPEPTDAEIREHKATLNARHSMKVGTWWFLGGCMITTLSYAGASASGKRAYIITYGPIIYGALRYMAGYKALRNLKRGRL